ncbi:MAG: hypothetical protein KKH84_04555 [Proteobacteria bacterium]|nr:hypothetical protein [Pseudomonadota bacterium]MBU4420261.1 hypothetical protein [Pseudomonadota bacterium]MCG2829913.1 hypothetical protein [Desulfobacteraceae bacterium]
MKLYWTSVEFEILNPSEYENCIGGFVYLFFKAYDVRDAIPKIENAISEENFKIIQIEFISEYDEIPWDTEEEQKLYDSLASKAQDSDEIIWDDLYTYEEK